MKPTSHTSTHLIRLNMDELPSWVGRDTKPFGALYGDILDQIDKVIEITEEDIVGDGVVTPSAGGEYLFHVNGSRVGVTPSMSVQVTGGLADFDNGHYEPRSVVVCLDHTVTVDGHRVNPYACAGQVSVPASLWLAAFRGSSEFISSYYSLIFREEDRQTFLAGGPMPSDTDIARRAALLYKAGTRFDDPWRWGRDVAIHAREAFA